MASGHDNWYPEQSIPTMSTSSIWGYNWGRDPPPSPSPPPLSPYRDPPPPSEFEVEYWGYEEPPPMDNWSYWCGRIPHLSSISPTRVKADVADSHVWSYRYTPPPKPPPPVPPPIDIWSYGWGCGTPPPLLIAPSTSDEERSWNSEVQFRAEKPPWVSSTYESDWRREEISDLEQFPTKDQWGSNLEEIGQLIAVLRNSFNKKYEAQEVEESIREIEVKSSMDELSSEFGNLGMTIEETNQEFDELGEHESVVGILEVEALSAEAIQAIDKVELGWASFTEQNQEIDEVRHAVAEGEESAVERVKG